jgi:hypothetical protein
VAGIAWAAGASSASQTVAAPSGPPSCSVTKSVASASLVCPPGEFTAGTPSGAPTEQQLTATNSARHIGGGGLL